MQRQPHAGLLGLGHDRLEEMLGARQLLRARVGSDVVFGRQRLRELVVVRGVAGAGTADLLLVAFDETVGVEVVLDDLQPDAPGGANRRDDVADLLVGRPAVPR